MPFDLVTYTGLWNISFDQSFGHLCEITRILLHLSNNKELIISMLFNSIPFLIFLPIVFLLYWIMPHKLRWVILLAASYFFYMYWNWKLVYLIMFTTAVSYICGLLMERCRSSRFAKKIILASTLVACIGVLLFFKYFNFMFNTYNDVVSLFGGNTIGGSFYIMLPVGISFYTFQTLSYVIDVYRGSIQAEKHFGYYALFVTFFPQLVAGPIERPQDLLPQLKEKKSFFDDKRRCNIDFHNAFKIMLIGFFKKIAVADVIGITVNAVYEDIGNANGLAILLATLLFSVQIFCDFSGYCDIAVGAAILFGVRLSENFKQPYSAKSIKEFWKRWHITLSSWLRDYIYFPLGGSRVNKVKWCLNILIVFFISGLWHGANYTFLVWGILHAVFQIIGSFTLKPRNWFWNKVHIDPSGRFVSVIRTVLCFLLVSFAWIFFRANSISDAWTAVVKIFSNYAFDADYFVQVKAVFNSSIIYLVYVIVLVGLTFFADKYKYKPTIVTTGGRIKSAVTRVATYGMYLVLGWCVIGSWIYLQASDVGSSFIYFQF